MVARPWSSSRLSCGERLLLRWDGNAGNSFPTSRERIRHLEVRGINGAPLDVGGTLVLPLEWRRYVGELLEFQQGAGLPVPLEAAAVQPGLSRTPGPDGKVSPALLSRTWAGAGPGCPGRAGRGGGL